MRARFETTLVRVSRYYWTEIVWWCFWYLSETLAVLEVVTWKSGAKRSRRQEADRSQIVLAVSACVVHLRCNYVTEKRAAMVTKDQALLIGRLASRKACHLSAGHRTDRSRRSSPCWTQKEESWIVWLALPALPLFKL